MVPAMTGSPDAPMTQPNPYGQAMPAALTPALTPEPQAGVSVEHNGARVEVDAATGTVRVISTTGRPLAPVRTPAEQRQLRRAQQAGARFEQRWRPKTHRLLADPALLARCLDEAEALPLGASHYWGGDSWLHTLSTFTRSWGVTEEGLRAALALIPLWPLPPIPAEPRPTRDEHLVSVAVIYSGTYDMLRVHAAVRGGPGAPWRARLPWAVLRPLRDLKGYDDRRIMGGPGDAICYGPPTEITYRALPLFQRAYVDMAAGLRLTLEAAARVFDGGPKARRAALATEMPTSPEQQRIERYFRAGDRIVDLPLLQELTASLRNEWLPRVAAQLEAIDALARDTSVRHRGKDGRLLAVYRRMAAGLAFEINRHLPDVRRGAGQDSKRGVHRQEVRERASAILQAVYGISITPDDVKSAVLTGDKRAKTQH
jgi:hypothetical protein